MPSRPFIELTNVFLGYPRYLVIDHAEANRVLLNGGGISVAPS